MRIRRWAILASLLGLVLVLATPTFSLEIDAWRIDAYVGWEFLDMDKQIVFYCEGSWNSAYPFVIEQKEYMEKAQGRVLEDVKEHFEDSFTPLVIVAHRQSEPRDRSFYISDVTCEADSHIYRANQLGRFEYQYVNLLRSSGPYAFFEVPPRITYTCFWLLPAKSLIEKVYLRGLVGDDERKPFRIEAEQAQPPPVSDEAQVFTRENIPRTVVRFSTPENVVKTYYEALFVKEDTRLCLSCWSRMVNSRLARQFSSPLVMRALLNNFDTFGKQWSTFETNVESFGDKTCVVTAEFKGLGEGEPDRLKVVKENNEWRILMFDGVYEGEAEWLHQETNPFPGLSTPEDTVRSFYAAVANNDVATAKSCWSYKTPYYLVDTLTEKMTKVFEDAEFLGPLVAALFASEKCEKEQINENSYYVWIMNPGDQGARTRSETNQYRVIEENGHWKLLIPKVTENVERVRLLLQALNEEARRNQPEQSTKTARVVQKVPWSKVISWEGNGIKTTEPFRIEGEVWRIEWQNSGYVLQVYLHKLNGDLVGVLVNTLDAGEDISYVYDKGEFYLTINAVGNWKISVSEKAY